MPSIVSRGNSLQNTQNYAITDNPVFKVKVMSLSNNYEQPANQPEKLEKEFKIGDIVTGKILNSKKSITGKIISFDKNKNFILVINIDDNKKYKLESKSLSLKKKEGNSEIALNFTPENKLLTYKEFLKLNEKY